MHSCLNVQKHTHINACMITRMHANTYADMHTILSECMCVFFTCIHSHKTYNGAVMHTYTHIYITVCMHTCIQSQTHSLMRTHTPAYLHRYMRSENMLHNPTYTHAYMHTHLNTWALTHINKYMFVCIHNHT